MFDSKGYSVLLCFLRLHKDRSVWAISSSSCQINFKESGALTTPSLEEHWQGFLFLSFFSAFNHTLGPQRSLYTTNAALIYRTDSLLYYLCKREKGTSHTRKQSLQLCRHLLYNVKERGTFTKRRVFMEVRRGGQRKEETKL